jgi:tetratricopeptide (TPR) repeat protein
LEYRKPKEAYKWFVRALEIDPNYDNNLCNFAGLLFSEQKRERGLSILSKCIQVLGDSPTSRTALKCWFYALVYREQVYRAEALRHIKRIILTGQRATGFTLDLSMEDARANNHPDVSWLEKLAQIITKRSPLDSLDDWDKWQNA